MPLAYPPQTADKTLPQAAENRRRRRKNSGKQLDFFARVQYDGDSRRIGPGCPSPDRLRRRARVPIAGQAAPQGPGARRARAADRYRQVRPGRFPPIGKSE